MRNTYISQHPRDYEILLSGCTRQDGDGGEGRTGCHTSDAPPCLGLGSPRPYGAGVAEGGSAADASSSLADASASDGSRGRSASYCASQSGALAAALGRCTGSAVSRALMSRRSSSDNDLPDGVWTGVGVGAGVGTGEGGGVVGRGRELGRCGWGEGGSGSSGGCDGRKGVWSTRLMRSLRFSRESARKAEVPCSTCREWERGGGDEWERGGGDEWERRRG